MYNIKRITWIVKNCNGKIISFNFYSKIKNIYLLLQFIYWLLFKWWTGYYIQGPRHDFSRNKNALLLPKPFRNPVRKQIPAVLLRTGLMTVYLLVFHRRHVANARVQSCAVDDKQSCLFAAISSVQQFCCRSNPTSLPALRTRTATPKTVGVKELRFFSQIMQVRWPAFSPVPSILTLFPSTSPLAQFISFSLSFSLSFAPTYDSLRLGLRAGEQPCFCRPIVSARVAASSARPLCEFINVFIHSASIVSQLLAYGPSPRQRFFLSSLIASVVMSRINGNLLAAKKW